LGRRELQVLDAEIKLHQLGVDLKLKGHLVMSRGNRGDWDNRRVVLSTSRVRLGPGQKALIRGQSEHRNQVLMIEASPKSVGGFQTANTMTSTSEDGTVMVQVANLGSSPVIVEEGDILGKATSISVQDVTQRLKD
jgi:hypothetical protein